MEGYPQPYHRIPVEVEQTGVVNFTSPPGKGDEKSTALNGLNREPRALNSRDGKSTADGWLLLFPLREGARTCSGVRALS